LLEAIAAVGDRKNVAALLRAHRRTRTRQLHINGHDAPMRDEQAGRYDGLFSSDMNLCECVWSMRSAARIRSRSRTCEGKLRAQFVALDPIALLQAIREGQTRLSALMNRSSACQKAVVQSTGLALFLESLGSAWRGGEVRATHRGKVLAVSTHHIAWAPHACSRAPRPAELPPYGRETAHGLDQRTK